MLAQCSGCKGDHGRINEEKEGLRSAFEQCLVGRMATSPDFQLHAKHESSVG